MIISLLSLWLAPAAWLAVYQVRRNQPAISSIGWALTWPIQLLAICLGMLA